MKFYMFRQFSELKGTVYCERYTVLLVEEAEEISTEIWFTKELLHTTNIYIKYHRWSQDMLY